MPELPEVETTRRGIAPYLQGHSIEAVLVRQPRLRWPVPPELPELLTGRVAREVARRGKYLLIGFEHGTVLVHLGMSGSLRLVPQDHPPGRHDHLDLVLDSGLALRLTDPRRFGAVLWQPPGKVHELLASLGPEPLSDAFDAACLQRACKGRRSPIKQVIMDSKVVVGVGNIYANEALFAAGIHPKRAAGRISSERLEQLVVEIKAVLARAIAQGGTTLRDFVGGDGKPGYFSQELSVYGRAGQGCVRCREALREIRLGQRSTVFCPKCQR